MSRSSTSPAGNSTAADQKRSAPLAVKQFDPQALLDAHLLLEEWKFRRQFEAVEVAPAPTTAKRRPPREGYTRKQMAERVPCSPTQFDRYRKRDDLAELLEPAFHVGRNPRWTQTQLSRLLAKLKKEGDGHEE